MRKLEELDLLHQGLVLGMDLAGSNLHLIEIGLQPLDLSGFPLCTGSWFSRPLWLLSTYPCPQTECYSVRHSDEADPRGL